MANEPDYKFMINGRTYEFRVGEVTGTLALECRKATGMPPTAFYGSMDVDSVGVMVWLTRRIAGERVRLEQVLEEVSMAAVVEGAETQIEPVDEPRVPMGDERAVTELVAQDPET